MKTIFTILVLALTVWPSTGATFTAASVSEAAVTTAYNLCSDGDTLIIPAGAANWTSTFTIAKAINFFGSGTNLSGTATIITNGLGSSTAPIIAITRACRIASNVFIGGFSGSWKTSGKGLEYENSGTINGVRIDHCLLKGFGLYAISGSAVNSGHAYGVIDHCEFVDNDTDYYGSITSSDGNAMWAAGPGLGTTNAMYLEDNVFLRTASYNQIAADEYHYHAQAAFSVIRYNTIKSLASVDQPVLDMHASYAGLRGTLAVEYYNNTVQAGKTYRYLHPRGGVFLCFSNTFTDTSGLTGFIYFDDTGGENADWITNSFVYGNTLNGSAQINGMIGTSSSRFQLNSSYWTVRPSAVNGSPIGIYQNYTPLVHPHPLITAQEAGGGTAPTITSSPYSLGQQGVALTYQIAGNNTPTSYGAANLPAGLSVNTGTGAITGTPTTNGAFSATIYATNATGFGSSSLFISLARTTDTILSNVSSSALTNAIASAVDGARIWLSATGSITWSNSIALANTKGLQIIGPGSATVGGGVWPLTVVNTNRPCIAITCETNLSLYRVSGLKFQNSQQNAASDGQWFDSFISLRGRGLGRQTNGAYRIDNNYFDQVGNNTTIGLDGSTGELTGLTDHNTFFDVGQNTVVYVIRIRELWKGGTASCWGYDSWARAFSYGTARFHYIEDNSFLRPNTEGRHDVACDGAGGKYVIRNNTFNRSYTSAYQMDYIDAHGDGTPGLGRGTRGGEIYNNIFQGGSSSVGRDINLRGGTWLVYSNLFGTYANMQLTEYRASTADCSQLDSPSICNPTVPQCVTAANFATYYPVPGQITNTFFWANVMGAAAQTPAVDGTSYVSTYIAQNRDYWVSNAMPSQLTYTAFAYPHLLEDETLPLPVSATINSGGTIVTFAASEPVGFGAGGSGGFTLPLSGGAVTMTYSSGAGTASLIYSLDRQILAGETGNLNYTQPSNGVEDLSGNDLATFSGLVILNNSTQTSQNRAVTTSGKVSSSGAFNTSP
jgi:hypothetical protein